MSHASYIILAISFVVAIHFWLECLSPNYWQNNLLELHRTLFSIIISIIYVYKNDLIKFPPILTASISWFYTYLYTQHALHLMPGHARSTKAHRTSVLYLIECFVIWYWWCNNHSNWIQITIDAVDYAYSHIRIGKGKGREWYSFYPFQWCNEHVCQFLHPICSHYECFQLEIAIALEQDQSHTDPLHYGHTIWQTASWFINDNNRWRQMR